MYGTGVTEIEKAAARRSGRTLEEVISSPVFVRLGKM